MELAKLKDVALAFLRIRGLQFGRILNEIGFIRIVVLLLFSLHVLIIIPKFFFYAPWLASAVFLFFLLSLHVRRKDSEFLRMYFGHYAKGVMLIEYQLLALPVMALMIYAGQLSLTIVLFISLFIIPYVNVSFRKIQVNRNAINFLPTTSFEFKSGIRKNYLSILFLVLLGSLLGKLIYMPVLAIFLLTIILASFSNYCESGLMVAVYNSSPNRFLNRKLFQQVILTFMLYFPINSSFLWFHRDYWYVLLAVNVIGLLIQALSVCFKYAFYIPGKELKGNNILLGAAIACFFIVFLAPVPLVMLVIYYVRAQRNLNRYLYVGS